MSGQQRSRWLLLHVGNDGPNDDWILVSALVILTFQLVRSSIELVKYMSALQQQRDDDEEKNKSSKEELSKHEPSRAATNYGSVEQEPLVAGTALGIRSTPFPISARKVVLTLVWALLATYFVFMATLSAETYAPLLIITSLAFAFEIAFLWLPLESSDYGVQRFFQLTVGILIASALVTLRIHLVAAALVMISFLVAKKPSPQLPHEDVAARAATAAASALTWNARWKLVKPYIWPDEEKNASYFGNRLRAISTWFCVIASKVTGIGSPLLLGWATTALAHQDYRGTMFYSIAYCAISWLSSTLKEMQSFLYLEVAQAAFCQLASSAFGHLHSLSLDWHLRKQMGQVLRSMDRGIAACDTLMKYLFLWLVPAMVECIVVCVIFALYFSYWELGAAVFYFVFAYVVWTIVVTVWRKKYRKALTVSDNKWHDKITDSLLNFETVKFFTAEEYELQEFREAVNRYQTGSVHVQGSLSFLNISQQVLLKSCLGVALSLTAHAIQQRVQCCTTVAHCESAVSECCRDATALCGGMQIGDFVTVLTYTLNLFAPLNFLGSVYNSIIMATIDLSNMTELLAENPDVVDSADALELPQDEISDIAIEFDNVHFHYPTQPKDRGLKGLSFKMKRGTTTAIVGPTGAGKTTVSRLLFRFYDVLGGAVKVNGIDVRSVTQASLRSAIGVVPQSASMFNGTIRKNILYGRRDATEEELIQAAKDAQILHFIESLDDGWKTLVGDRGLKLSGGESRHSSLLVEEPAFCFTWYVLLHRQSIPLTYTPDEATSALDTLTENSVQEALDRLTGKKERTVLVIAHRLGTIRNAENIVVLNDGRVAEQGTHDELLAKDGRYADMWNMQLHATSSSVTP